MNAEIAKGTAFGSLVHDVLERIESAEGLELESLIDNLRTKHNIAQDEAQQAKELIHAVLSSPTFQQRVEHSDRLFRELPFSVELEGVLYEGRMDLVFFDDGQSVILDYKTDHGEPQALAAKYKGQAQVYARALEQITGQPVKEVILYHVRRNEPVVLSRDELALLKA